jgi:hypothetical protein
MTHSTQHTLRLLSCSLLAAALSACGGGTGGGESSSSVVSSKTQSSTQSIQTSSASLSSKIAPSSVSKSSLVASSVLSSIMAPSSIAKSSTATSLANSSNATSSTTGNVPVKPAYWDNALDFSEGLPLRANLTGTLAGEVKFIQSRAVYPKRNAGEERALLTMHREALLMFTPTADTNLTKVDVTVTNNAGQTFNTSLAHPYAIPGSDQNTSDSRPRVLFSKNAWSVAIPWQYVTNKMSISLTSNNGKTSTLKAGDIDVSAPMELVTLHIDLGMLTEPQGTNTWTLDHGNRNARLALDYFQKMPIAKFTTGQYLPVHLKEIVMSNGEYYKTKSSFTGADVYTGDLRESIAKGLISIGINQANVGVLSASADQDSSTRPFRETVVHTSRGVYTDAATGQAAVVPHGLSGGAGKLTLLGTEGNEFTHEYGHDHGLGHYPGDDKSFYTQDAGWGYDIFRQRFIGTVYWQTPATTASIDTNSTTYKKEAYAGKYTWNTDAMGGGGTSGNISVFTQHTGYSTFLIQNNLVGSSGVLDASSATGYKFWNATTQTMTDKVVGTPKPDQMGVPVMTLLGYYDPQLAMNGFNDHVAGGKKFPNDNGFIFPALYANWGNYFTPDTVRNSKTALANSKCELAVTDSTNNVLHFPLLDTRLSAGKMNQFHVNLPTKNTVYSSAQLLCSTKVMATISIAPPSAVLPAAIVVGKEAGMVTAALKLPAFSESYYPQSFADEAELEEGVSHLYGPTSNYASDKPVTAGKLYKYQGNYYLSKKDGINSAPSNASADWYLLGEGSTLISKDTLGIDKVGTDYVSTVLNRESAVIYYIPADGVNVLESEASSPAVRQWYAAGSYSTLKVNAISTANGKVYPVALRGGATPNANNAIGNYRKLQSGVGKEESGMARIYMVAADNPSLPAGSYNVSFNMYATGWHKEEFIRAIKVSGTVVK